MSLMAVLAALLKVAGQILELYSQGALTQEKLDRVVNSLHEVN